MAETLSIRALDQFDGFFSDLYDACDAMDIPADAATSESGLGQFEINLMHGDDALKAADDAWLFKMLVKGLARRHGFAASFMAKPYADYAGSGLHTHFSVLDAQGANIFDDGTPQGSAAMRHAVAGLMDAMQPSGLIFAPHANSYDRLVPHAHAPTGVAWAYENRTASIRIPSGSTKARRIEHRTAGGDVNPYLMLAAVLGGAMNGLDDASEPPAPITGNAYDHDLPQIPADWATAIDLFESAPQTARIFSPELIRNLVLTKRQELASMSDLTPQEQVEIYLDTV
jgi:glutamine synthetase